VGGGAGCGAVATRTIYIQVLNRGPAGVRGLLDRWPLPAHRDSCCVSPLALGRY
jgi:hypothetical protein